MPSQRAQTSFCFINSTEPLAPQSDDVRRIVRQRAMAKAAVTRRQNGNWGKVNLLQYPVNSHDTHSLEKQDEPRHHSRFVDKSSGQHVSSTGQNVANIEAVSEQPSPVDCTDTIAEKGVLSLFKIAPNMSPTGYEALRRELNFDILDLSALTTYYVSRITAQQLARQPSQLVHVLRCRQWSFISYLPSRWGNTPCLEAVTKCLVIRVREFLQGSGQPPSKYALALFGRAVCSVQSALDDLTLVTDPDVLCAVRLLSLWELLSESQPEAWDYHMSGANALLKLRGPTAYTTPFEKALLLAMVGPMFTEAMMQNIFTFVDEEPWQRAIQNCMIKGTALSDCSELSISLWIILCPIPRLMHEVQELVCRSQRDELIPSHIVSAYIQCSLSILQKLQSWRHSYDEFMRTLGRSSDTDQVSFLAVPNTSTYECDKSFELLGICLGSTLIMHRLLVTLSPSQPISFATEAAAQTVASEIVELEQQASQSSPRAALFMEFKMILARSVMATKDWYDVVSTAISEEDKKRSLEASTGDWNEAPTVRLIDKEVFEHWCRHKGRKVATSKTPLDHRHYLASGQQSSLLVLRYIPILVKSGCAQKRRDRPFTEKRIKNDPGHTMLDCQQRPADPTDGNSDMNTNQAQFETYKDFLRAHIGVFPEYRDLYFYLEDHRNNWDVLDHNGTRLVISDLVGQSFKTRTYDPGDGTPEVTLKRELKTHDENVKLRVLHVVSFERMPFQLVEALGMTFDLEPSFLRGLIGPRASSEEDTEHPAIYRKSRLPPGIPMKSEDYLIMEPYFLSLVFNNRGGINHNNGVYDLLWKIADALLIILNWIGSIRNFFCKVE
ncbi:uncharacterized protein KY384_005757 [Bacidia gigantensis]|uniref:uncharacterized protein n=1 Tax=Bacidia gigantensis TaxID=2732470 RepID=UPI001D0442E6|nr:uncharacterized protein KY384_005757 [Bacidia gigantensis]KAG8529122.1 hypothetical protein KY384_005757 [Bacidia gigantensis]